jgi:hypothetical protein
MSKSGVFARRALRAGAVACVLSLGVTTSSRAQDTTGTIRFKAVTLTPILAAVGDAFWRSRNLTSDIGSPYQNIPFDNTTNAKTSEFRATGRHSRLGVFAEARSESDSIAAFWEIDFLAAGTTSKSEENDGYAARIRNAWVVLTTQSKTSIAAGQMWTLLTPNKKGLVPRSEQIPLTIDAQYAVGFNWARQAALRLFKTGDVFSYGASIEGAQTTFAARNAPNDFVVGQPGGSQMNSLTNYSTDLSPDIVGKIAFDPKGYGHWELKAVGRFMRDRIVDPTNTNGGSRFLTALGGGVGFGIYYPVMSSNRDVVDLGLSGLFGQGIGRYGTGQLVDATIGSDGKLKPLRAAQAVATIEAHPSRKLDVYTYEGFEYADRASYVDALGRGVGYGSPLNVNTGCETETLPSGPFGPASGVCNADNRSLVQGNLGFWYRIRRNAAGTLQWGMQYSHTVRNTWSGIGGAPRGTENMLFSSFRYLL